MVCWFNNLKCFIMVLYSLICIIHLLTLMWEAFYDSDRRGAKHYMKKKQLGLKSHSNTEI